MSVSLKLLLCLGLSCFATAMAFTEARAAFSISWVAVTGPTPDGNADFVSLQFPALDDGVVAFAGDFEDAMATSEGVFVGSSPESLVLLVVEIGDPLPENAEEFLIFCVRRIGRSSWGFAGRPRMGVMSDARSGPAAGNGDDWACDSADEAPGRILVRAVPPLRARYLDARA